jgi:hypothetical protein
MLWFGAVSRRHWVALGIALSAGAGLQCSSREHPPSFVEPPANTSGGQGAGGGLTLLDASMDAALCGNEQIPAITDPPNLYFVVDRSGSMLDPLPDNPRTKYENARIAISVMLRAIGHRVRYGAAVFPAPLNQDCCSPGAQIFPTTAGDPPNYAAHGENGPILTDLLKRLGNLPPAG